MNEKLQQNNVFRIERNKLLTVFRLEKKAYKYGQDDVYQPETADCFETI